MARTGILLESGTNELEVLVFSLSGQRYGVNVAKVREVINPVSVASLPGSHAAVDGVFQLREKVIPLVNLGRAVGLADAGTEDEGKIIVMEFNDNCVAFAVDAVEQIYRVNWKDVSSAPDSSGLRAAPITSIAFIDDAMIPMLDFERLVFEIAGVDLFTESEQLADDGTGRADVRILLAEDSPTMRMLIQKNLSKAGYGNLTLCHDGQKAWDALLENIESGEAGTFDLLITDIEMPQIDGLHLTRRIREHQYWGTLPIIIFSSIVSSDNEKKCQSVGADAQITKPQLSELVALVDGIMHKVRSGERPAPATKTSRSQSQPVPAGA